MKINEIKYSRVFNLGNYENETVSIGVFVEEGEDPSKILSDVKGFVNTAKTRSVSPPSPVNEVKASPPVPVVSNQVQSSAASNAKSNQRSSPAPKTPSKSISEKQLNRLYAIAKKCNYNDLEVSRLASDHLGVEDPSLMRWQDYDKFCKFLEKNPKANDEMPF